MLKKISKYAGIVLALLVIGSVLAKNYFLPPKSERQFEERFHEVIFSDASGEIEPQFFHEDNKIYYEGSKLSAFRSLFFAPGIAVADLNQDGLQDFVTLSSKAGDLPLIYLNEKGRKFKLDQSWIDKKSLPKANKFDANIAPFLADFDDDGDLDLLVTSLKCSKFFLNQSQKFIYQPNHIFSKDCKGSTSALPYDFDKNGKLDLLLIRYWSTKWQDAFEEMDDGAFQDKILDFFKDGNVALNGANGAMSPIYFDDSTMVSLNGEDDTNWSFDALVTDLDHDGIDELVMANDFGNDRIYHLSGKQLIEVTKDFKYFDRRNGMSLATNYLPNDPLPFLFSSNIWIENYQEKGNFYWQYDAKKKRLVNHAERASLDNCKWAWGAAFGDFNMDGFNDVYVANGYITFPDSKKYEKEGRFKTAYFASLPSASSVQKFLMLKKKEPTQSIKPNQIFITAGSGQKDALRIYSPLTKQFLEAKKDPVLDKDWDGRASAMIDFDNDGDLDLLVTTQNDYLRLLRNDTQEKYHKKNWVGFEIKNQQFLRKITATQNGRKYYKDWLGGRSGFLTTSDSRVYFTFDDESDVEVDFQFLDGRIVSKKFAAGKYYNLGKI